MAKSWPTEVRRILQDVTYRTWRFEVVEKPESTFLMVVFRDDDTGDEWAGRKWYLSPHMTPSEVVQTALKAVLTAEEHEAREKFLYRGRAVFGPHYDVDQLHELAGQGEGALDVR